MKRSPRRINAIDVTPEQRRKIGVDHRGIAAPDEFHERAYFVARGDVGEPFLARDLRRLALMRRVGIGMHEDDGNGGDAFGARRAERRPHRARSSGVSTPPSARTRSGTSTTRA